ncbi:hypothetical protein [Eoetvoesiella caeni]|uniref:hypothetical protein n=1 Tax=Eoetvoesiella caeni TaxID=645616 RepID=UPI00363A651B
MLELGEEPYDIAYGDSSTMWVLKMPAAAVRLRLGDPRRFSARGYDMQTGIARLFCDYLHCGARMSYGRRRGIPADGVTFNRSACPEYAVRNRTPCSHNLPR